MDTNNNEAPKKSPAGKIIGWIVVLIIFAGVKIYFGNSSNNQAAPAMPQGLSDTDSVMTYLGNHKKSDEQISLTSATAQWSEVNDRDLQDKLKTDPVIFVMENKETGRYVFKYKSHYVYLIKEITDFDDDDNYTYEYFVVGIKKNSDGKLYLKELNANKFDDSNAKETDGYSIEDYNNYYGPSDSDD
jgi:hypothetical protein